MGIVIKTPDTTRLQRIKTRLSIPNWRFYLLITIFGLLVCLPLLNLNLVLDGHDIGFHLYRYKGTLNSLLGGQTIPQVDPHALNGFGYGYNIFYSPLSSYAVVVLRAIVSNWAIAVNLFTALTVVLSGVFVFRFLKDVTKSPYVGLFASFLYMAAPYHLLDIFIRQSQGELFPFVFAPLLFHGLWGIVNKRHYSYFMIIIAGTGLVLSHNLSALLFATFAVIYCLMNFRQYITPSILPRLFACCLFVIGLSSFYTLPLIEARQTSIYNIFSPDQMILKSMTADGLHNYSLPISRLIYNPVSLSGIVEAKEMPFAVGAFYLLAVVLLVVSYKNIPTRLKKFTKHFLIMAIITLVLTTNFIPWKILPSVYYGIQFPWRLLSLSVLFISIVASISIYYLIPKAFRIRQGLIKATIVVVATGAIASSYNILGYATYKNSIPVDYNYQISTVSGKANNIGHTGEYLPNTTTLTYLHNRQRTPEVISGRAKIDGYTEKGLVSELYVKNSEKTASIELPFIFYPGYESSTGKVLASKNGLVEISIPSNYSGGIRTYYGISPYTRAGVLISSVSVLILIAIIAWRRDQL